MKIIGLVISGITASSAHHRVAARPSQGDLHFASQRSWYVVVARIVKPTSPANQPTTKLDELDQKIQDVLKRIETERKVLDASRHLRQATSNPDVLRRNDAKIREAERSLSYFEDTLRELQARKKQQADPSRSTASSPLSPSSANKSNRGADRDRSLPQIPPSDPDSSGPGRTAGPFDSQTLPESEEGMPQTKQYSNLDLIKADTPHTTAKISRMLHQLEFKLQVELQYKKGIDKMAKLYQADGDKKSRADAESKRVESEKKIQLLQSALKRYKNLHILDDVEEEDQQSSEISFSVASITSAKLELRHRGRA